MKRKKGTSKNNGAGCVGILIILFVIFSVISNANKQSSTKSATALPQANSATPNRSQYFSNLTAAARSASTASARQVRTSTLAPSLTNTSLPSPTITPSSSSVDQAANSQVVSLSTQHEPTPSSGSISVVGNGIKLSLDEILIYPGLGDEPASNDALVVLIGSLLSVRRTCLNNRNFELIVNGEAHSASLTWMRKLQPQLPQHRFPGPHSYCVGIQTEKPTFLIFDAPVDGDGPILKLFDSRLYLGSWEALGYGQFSLPIPTAAVTTNPTNTPTLTASARLNPNNFEDYTATGNANVRRCPYTRTDCDVIAGLVLGQRLKKVGQVQGESVNGSSLWYEIILDDGSTGFVHGGLVRAGTPRPAPVQTTPRPVATNVPNSQPTQPVILPTIPQSTVAPQQWACGGNFYNCDDFANRNDLMNYWHSCPGDPSHLDHDDDGIPCEF